MGFRSGLAVETVRQVRSVAASPPADAFPETLRMCYGKRWRFVLTRRRELLRLDVLSRQAIRHTRNWKGPWHMAKTIASGVGLTNAWLQEQGLLSLKSLRAAMAPLR